MIRRPCWSELERRCQKVDHRRLGNWMARRVTRPLALRITWLVLPWRVSANAATMAAWAVAAVGAAALATGTVHGWLVGALLLHVWYVLDHVDGQLARWRGTASLDGVQLDYLMHHSINLGLPLAIGYGLWGGERSEGWLLVGVVWGWGLLTQGLLYDARYKAFIQRLKLMRGTLQAVGGGGGRPAPAAAMPRRPLRAAAWLVRKSCEIHVTVNVVSAIAAAQWLMGDTGLAAGRGYSAMMAVLAPGLAMLLAARGIRDGASEAEFAAWFRPPAGCRLVLDEGWWRVERCRPPGGETTAGARSAADGPEGAVGHERCVPQRVAAGSS